MLIAYAAAGSLGVLRRCEERWQPPVTLGAVAAGADLAFAVTDGGRSRTEGLERTPALAAEITECDAPPAVALHASERAGARVGERGWVSADGGVRWRPRGAAAGRNDGAARSDDARSDDARNGGARPDPPAPDAAVTTLTLTDHDRAALGAARLYAAAWPTGGGVALGTAGADGHWRQTMAAAVPGGSGPCALTATADGVLLACVDGRAIRCRRIPLDAVLGAEAGAGAGAGAADASWHHDGADLIAALAERRPAAVP